VDRYFGVKCKTGLDIYIGSIRNHLQVMNQQKLRRDSRKHNPVCY